jgi:hypothetical protein
VFDVFGLFAVLDSAIDRLIQLVQYPKHRYRAAFDDLLKPAFDELMQVHSDYIQMFEETRRLLPSLLYARTCTA